MSNSFPPITVLIPAYNVERYIVDAISSAGHQFYEGEIHIIVLDDGSTDQTYTVAKKAMRDYSNLTVFSQPNRGRVGARNRLLDLAETEFIAWLDGDDIAPPSWLIEQFTLIHSSESLVAVSGQGYAMTKHRLPIGPIERPISNHEISTRHYSGASNAFFQSCTLVRKSKVVKAGCYRDKYPASEDYDLWLRLHDLGTFANHSNVHLFYRVHDTSANATIADLQRNQGLAAANEARAAKGLRLLQANAVETPSTSKKNDWNREVYWTNIAMKSGNPWTAVQMLSNSIPRHGMSLVLWLMLAVATLDVVRCFGNCSSRFEAGAVAKIGTLPRCSAYRMARWLNSKRKRFCQ